MTVKNANYGEGWTDTAGTGSAAPIAKNTDPGQKLNDYKKVQFPAASYTVTVAGGANATASGGDSTQEVTAGSEMTAVTYTANDGFHFEAFGATTTEGVAMELKDGKVVVYGTPTGDVELEVPDAVADAKPASGSVTYAAHTQTYGWGALAGADGTTAGTTGQSKRLEAITAKVDGATIEYRSHVQGTGWEKSWAKDGDVSGTTGQSKRIEAIQMRLSGAEGQHVWYRVHTQTYGWLGWACDGMPAGTTGQYKRAEAFQVLVLGEGEVPDGYDATRPAYIGYVNGNAHAQTYGWLGSKLGGTFGTTGQYKRLEALRLKLSGQPFAGGLEYQLHLQRTGWEKGWAADGAQAGTTGQFRRAEAVRIRLTPGSDMEASMSVWYRVHSQTFGWLGWTCDGQAAGTTGMSKRAEAVEVQVLPKGSVPLDYDAGKAAYRNS